MTDINNSKDKLFSIIGYDLKNLIYVICSLIKLKHHVKNIANNFCYYLDVEDNTVKPQSKNKALSIIHKLM